MPDSYAVNQLKTWSKCQKKYEFDYVRKLNWPSNPKNFRLGKGVHQLLDYESRNLPIEPILQDTDEDIHQVWSILHRCRWATLPIIVSEWGFSLEVDGKWIYGRIDRIVRDGDTIHILDWKTGTGIPKFPEEDWQTLIYLYAVYTAQRDLGISIRSDQLVFTYVQVRKGQVVERQIPYSDAMHQHTAQKLAETFRAIESTGSFRLPGPTCPDSFCPYRKICGIEKPEDNISHQSWDHETSPEPMGVTEGF
jgi:CRISPR/Cas system-associated exonuclease Cas4 (RecB family)